MVNPYLPKFTDEQIFFSNWFLPGFTRYGQAIILIYLSSSLCAKSISSDIFNNLLLTNIPVSLIQPVNDGIVHNMKHFTRRDFMKFIHCVGIGNIL